MPPPQIDKYDFKLEITPVGNSACILSRRLEKGTSQSSAHPSTVGLGELLVAGHGRHKAAQLLRWVPHARL